MNVRTPTLAPDASCVEPGAHDVRTRVTERVVGAKRAEEDRDRRLLLRREWVYASTIGAGGAWPPAAHRRRADRSRRRHSGRSRRTPSVSGRREERYRLARRVRHGRLDLRFPSVCEVGERRGPHAERLRRATVFRRWGGRRRRRSSRALRPLGDALATFGSTSSIASIGRVLARPDAEARLDLRSRHQRRRLARAEAEEARVEFLDVAAPSGDDERAFVVVARSHARRSSQRTGRGADGAFRRGFRGVGVLGRQGGAISSAEVRRASARTRSGTAPAFSRRIVHGPSGEGVTIVEAQFGGGDARGPRERAPSGPGQAPRGAGAPDRRGGSAAADAAGESREQRHPRRRGPNATAATSDEIENRARMRRPLPYRRARALATARRNRSDDVAGPAGSGLALRSPRRSRSRRGARAIEGFAAWRAPPAGAP